MMADEAAHDAGTQAEMGTSPYAKRIEHWLAGVETVSFSQTDTALHDLSVSVSSGSTVILLHMNAPQGYPRCGFALTDEGIYCRDLRENAAHFVDWQHLGSLGTPVLDGPAVHAGDVALACYVGNATVRSQLLELMIQLQSMAQNREAPPEASSVPASESSSTFATLAHTSEPVPVHASTLTATTNPTTTPTTTASPASPATAAIPASPASPASPVTPTITAKHPKEALTDSAPVPAPESEATIIGDPGESLPVASPTRRPAYVAPTHIETVEDFMECAPWKDLKAGADHVLEFSCPTCGTSMLAHETTLATTCPYCGDSVLMAPDTDHIDVPSFILPFSVTKDRAQELLSQHLASAFEKYLPQDFDPQVEHVQGIYVPYWLFDVHVKGEVGVTGTRSVKRGKRSYIQHYALRAGGEATFYRIAVDGSSRMPDNLMETLAPFDITMLVPFDPQHLEGFLAEAADENADTRKQRAIDLARSSFVQEGRSYIRREDSYLSSVGRAVERWADTTTERTSLCAMPVWLLHCVWRGENLLFAVNGQTGKCVGNLPVDEKRRKHQSSMDMFIHLFPLFVEAFLLLITGMGWLLVCLIPLAPSYVKWARKEVSKLDASRMSKHRSAAKPVDSHENQVDQRVNFSYWRARQAASAGDASASVCHRAERLNRYESRMYHVAWELCEGYLKQGKQQVWRALVEPQSTSDIPSIIPFDDDVIAIQGKKHSEYAVTSRGFYCFQRSGKRQRTWVPVGWQELARSRGVVLDDDSIICNGLTLAYDIPKRERSELLSLYHTLWVTAREVYSDKAAESPQSSAKEAQGFNQDFMATGSQRACRSLIMRVGAESFSHTSYSRRDLSLPTGASALIIHLNLGQDHPQSGFAVTDTGISCRDPREGKAHFVDWEHLARMPKPQLEGSFVRSGSVSLACYEGDASVRAELLKLFRTLWRLSKDPHAALKATPATKDGATARDGAEALTDGVPVPTPVTTAAQTSSSKPSVPVNPSTPATPSSPATSTKPAVLKPQSSMASKPKGMSGLAIVLLMLFIPLGFIFTLGRLGTYSKPHDTTSVDTGSYEPAETESQGGEKAQPVVITFSGGKGATGSVEPIEALSGTNTRLPPNGFSLEGKNFYGWRAARYAGQGGVVIGAGSDIAVDYSHAYEAVWGPDVSFDGNGASSGSMEPQQTDAYGEITLPVCAYRRTGYRFLGWSQESGSDIANPSEYVSLRQPGERYWPGARTPTIYAQWIYDNEWNVDEEEKKLEAYDLANLRIAQDALKAARRGSRKNPCVDSESITYVQGEDGMTARIMLAQEKLGWQSADASQEWLLHDVSTLPRKQGTALMYGVQGEEDWNYHYVIEFQ